MKLSEFLAQNSLTIEISYYDNYYATFVYHGISAMYRKNRYRIDVATEGETYTEAINALVKVSCGETLYFKGYDEYDKPTERKMNVPDDLEID